MRSALSMLVLFASVICLAQPSTSELAARWELLQTEATIGDRIDVRLIVEVPAGVDFEAPVIGPKLGEFSVVDGQWDDVRPDNPVGDRIWSGRVTAFEIGELELPSLEIRLDGPQGEAYETATEPLSVLIESVLEPGESELESEPELADLKAPASLAPDYRPLLWSGAILGLLLLFGGVAWWLVRRYGNRLSAVPVPDDPFGRVPPHVWIYAELQRLLDRRLAEQGEVPEFFSELSRILKQYLSGRYRVDLMEQTTAEVPEWLRQSGCPEEWIDRIVKLLQRCDLVKFARLPGSPDDCRGAVEQAYEIVDGTKPLESSETSETPAAARGAA